MTGGLKGLRKISISCSDFKMKDNGKSSQMFPLPGPKYERCLFYFHGNSIHDTEGDGDVHEMSVVETCVYSPCLKLVNPTKIKAKQGFIIQNSPETKGFEILMKNDCTLIKVDFDLE